MKQGFLVLVVCAFVGILVGSQPQQAASQVEIPSDIVNVPSDFAEPDLVSFPQPVVPIADDPAVCVDGSCSPAVSSSGVSSSDGYSATGPVRRLVEKKPVRRIVGRVFSRLRGCR